MTYVKICGVQSVGEALAARDAGADLVGVVFAESRRRLTVETARAIGESLGGGAQLRLVDGEDGAERLERLLEAKRPSLVGVFEGQAQEEIESIAARAGLDALQLHGEEAPVEELAGKWPVIRALDPDDLAVRRDVLLMLDGSRGRGRLGDWAALAEVASSMRFILAGGLTVENVGEAIRRLHPWGVDVSSGVETGGRKDPAKMREFVWAAKGAPT